MTPGNTKNPFGNRCETKFRNSKFACGASSSACRRSLNKFGKITCYQSPVVGTTMLYSSLTTQS
ncbi:hypothetical protein CY34DRAFT_807176 [Suillus luteus UH-Slu-Lm8-n1]|uniref:Uncharacterized protein n=1 Tax=Suillus luteus UH-Slu-Lm8-n1 TaxID=930992 RepID=A0A0D0AFG2_9AGAM|nr:hypothetical protein CY34DRAFT_807176 [Suillus luteus UH-Slu-Lm8-n1]